MVVWILCLLAIIAACGTISPRRIVINSPPSPSPTGSPTPLISPTPTPTATPTPTGMSAVFPTQVPTQFLFTADHVARVILGFKINRDGGLSAVPGSPFFTPNSPTLLVAGGKHLFVADETGLTVFAVNGETGTLTRLDSVAMPSITNLGSDSEGTVFATSGTRRNAVRVVNNKLQLGSVSGIMLLRPGASAAPSQSGPEVKDVSGQFFYSLNSRAGEISAFRLEDGTAVPLSPATYAAGHGSASLALVTP